VTKDALARAPNVPTSSEDEHPVGENEQGPELSPIRGARLIYSSPGHAKGRQKIREFDERRELPVPRDLERGRDGRS